MMIIKDVVYFYYDGKTGLGPYVDFLGEVQVPSSDYDSIVSTIAKEKPEIEKIKVISFKKEEQYENNIKVQP